VIRPTLPTDTASAAGRHLAGEGRGGAHEGVKAKDTGVGADGGWAEAGEVESARPGFRDGPARWADRIGSRGAEAREAAHAGEGDAGPTSLEGACGHIKLPVIQIPT
jgi:hypothetical protein